MMKTKMISVLLTFCFLFTLAFPTLIAHADDEVVYESVYYITDNRDFAQYTDSAVYNAYQQYAYSLEFTQINILRENTPDVFKEFYQYALDITEPSIVIVELISRIPRPGSNSNEPIAVEYLLDAFTWLKSRNCKIIFISGNDEDIYQDAVELLDYVDVHVNVDFEYMMVKGIVTKIALNEDTDSFYFIVDNTFCNLVMRAYDFTDRWLLPYIRYIYEDEYNDYYQNTTDSPKMDFDEYIQSKDIKFFGQTQGNTLELYEYLSNQSVPFDSDSNGQFVNNIARAYMIGRTYSTSNSAWYSMVNSLNAELSGSRVFTITLRGTNSSTLDFNSNVQHTELGIESLMFYGQITPPWTGIYTFSDIVTDFIAGVDMQKYNNLGGQCLVTYMPVIPSPDGWIPLRMSLPCFQVGSTT